MKNKLVISELKRLNDNGVITDEILEKVKNYYDNEKKGRSFSNYLVVIGLIMISLGIILLFAYNWANITRSIKVILIILVLMSSQTLFGYSLFKNKKWLSGAGVFVFAMSGLSIAMISQMYNISGSQTSYYMTWIMLNIPTLYLCRSKLVGVFYAVISYLYIRSGGSILVYLPLIIPALILKNNEEKYNKIGEILIKVIGLVGVFYWYEGLRSTGRYYLPFYAGVLAIIYLWPIGLKKGAGILILFLAYIQTIDGGHLAPRVVEYSTKPILSWSVYLLALGSLIYLKRWKDPINYFIVLIIPIYFLGVGEILCTIYLFSMGIYYIWLGLKENTVKVFNKGSFLVGLILISKFLDYNISTLLRGILFIAIGILFISLNLWMSRRKI